MPPKILSKILDFIDRNVKHAVCEVCQGIGAIFADFDLSNAISIYSVAISYQNAYNIIQRIRGHACAANIVQQHRMPIKLRGLFITLLVFKADHQDLPVELPTAPVASQAADRDLVAAALL